MGVRQSARIAAQNAGRKPPQNELLVEDPDALHDAISISEPDDTDCSRPAKRRKTATTPWAKPGSSFKTELHQIRQTLFSPSSPTPAVPGHGNANANTNITYPLPSFPSRSHPLSYHRPLLLTSTTTRQSLLTWFETVHTARNMPWRKPFINPNPSSYHDQDPLKLRSRLAQRAYEVWISEIMLQQTRVSVVIDYWTKWMARWPTISDLAAAQLEEVLEVWAGLGYYSRARRVHQAARMVCGHGSESETGMNGVLPSSVEELCKVPGVGRYTAGAIAAIVFGLPEPMVDGNVLRVLSRQMAVLGDVKGDRKVVEVLWDAAGELVKAVARDEDPEGGPSDRPGRWGQALMELGSTVCTPKPNCGKCPITETCRAYGEGLALAKGERECGEVMDIEELCDLCSSFEGQHELDGGKKTVIRSKKSSKRATRSRFFASTGPSEHPSEEMLETAVSHASKFPLKKPKKTIPEQETLVCAIRGPDGRFLIHKRPDKGLLAGLWEMPSCVLPDSNVSAAKRKRMAMSYASSLVTTKEAKGTNPRPAPALRHLGELGSIPWQFSHLRLTMHVHLFDLDYTAKPGKPVFELDAHQRWASQEALVTMGTGMKKCWSLVKQSIDQRPNISGT